MGSVAWRNGVICSKAIEPIDWLKFEFEFESVDVVDVSRLVVVGLGSRHK